MDVGAADGRRDTGTPHWETWKVKEGRETTQTFGGVTVTLRGAGEERADLETFLTKAGIDTGATMATDGVACDVGIELEIRGLAAGTHTVATYHNSIWDEPVGRATVSCLGASIGTNEEAPGRDGIEPSRKVTHDDDVASGFVRFVAAGDVPVVVRITPDGGGGRRVALLNGFEIDGIDPRRKARKPFPANDDEHVDGDSGRVELRWTPGTGAVRHDVYLASGRDPIDCAARVASANRDGPEFLCSVREPRQTVDIADHDSVRHTFWRVDEVDENGRMTRGEVQRFRVRHLAFPGAEGYGRHARGGRGGRVIEVTNLDDSGPGSLRAAVEAEGPRTVVFNVSGLITLESKLVINRANSYLTVAGQTAPGKGICIRNWTFGAIGARDTIVRYVRLRLGNLAEKTMDGMGLASADHCIIDHCSISWTIDEAFSSRAAKNITLQRTLIAEALNEAGHRKYPPGTRHGYAASIGGDIGSFHHNLLAHCAGRNWSLAGGLDQAGRHTGRLDIRNNVVFNWDHRTTDGGAMEVQFVANYYKPGPASRVFHVLKPERNHSFGPQNYYVEGNVMEGHYGSDEPLAGVVQPPGEELSAFVEARPFFEPYVTTHSASEAYENVLANVGCNVPTLDEHDQRIIAEVREGTTTYVGSKTGLPGIPDSQADVGGWDDYNYPEVHRPEGWDTDHDGLPNHWETAQGLDPENGADGATDPDGDGFTNLEDYLDWLAAGSPAVEGGVPSGRNQSAK